MQLNKVLWTNRNLKNPSSREETTLEFIDEIQKSSPEFDFNLVAKDFSKLPEINTFDKDFPKLSRPAKKFFKKVNFINNQNPEIGLKIITILACNIDCAFYTPKLKETVFQILNELLISESLSLKKRLEWGLFCWENRALLTSDFNKYK